MNNEFYCFFHHEGCKMFWKVGDVAQISLQSKHSLRRIKRETNMYVDEQSSTKLVWCLVLSSFLLGGPTDLNLP